MAVLRDPVQLGVVGAPHGIRGELRVKSFTQDPLAIGDYGPLHTDDGRELLVQKARPAKNVLVVSFAGVNDRSGAEALAGARLFVERAVLPQDLDEEEYYHADLIGLSVRDAAGEDFGKVIAVHDFGAGDILEVKPVSGRSVMMPFTRDAVPEVKPSAGYMVVDPAAAGLIASDEDGSEADESEAHP
ncbi:ribosome maturation factor RimM [Nitratireductor basaltis]|uniref:Ribosome maturation factor RimM n=1 Tax=Nitratireductor basaltis TaxID=472175 RepID=A0A084U6W1_9HYPH|nr:ribosome maturation factor RimM [Nitratireductor basaltis]KFB08697.1 Ribosome maturation factor RimM [Nitratireductor basaltis]